MSQGPTPSFASIARCAGVGLIALSLLAACGPKAPPPPLLSPVSETKGRYGYEEKEIDGARMEVSYVAPLRRLPVSASYRGPYTKASIDLATDLALWRAAELARKRAIPNFTVEERRTDVIVDRFRGGVYPDPFFGPPYPYYYRYPRARLYPSPYPFPYYTYEPPRAYGRAVVRLRIYFGTLTGRRSRSTNAVIEQMTRKYGAMNAPAPPAKKPPPKP